MVVFTLFLKISGGIFINKIWKMENPLNYYGPFIPVEFESKKDSGNGGISEKEVQNMIETSLTNAVFVGDTIQDSNTTEG